MNERQISIIFVSNDKERLEKYKKLLAADTSNKIITCTFQEAFNQVFIEENSTLENRVQTLKYEIEEITPQLDDLLAEIETKKQLLLYSFSLFPN